MLRLSGRKVYPENSRQLKTSKDIYNYIHGGKGVVTLEAPSGKTHTYAFLAPVNEEEFTNDVIFIYVLHEYHKFFYLGMIEDDYFRLTKHSRFDSNTEAVRGAKYIMKMSCDDELVKTTPMKLYHLGICCRCGRELTQESSLEHGMGRRCRKILMSEGSIIE